MRMLFDRKDLLTSGIVFVASIALTALIQLTTNQSNVGEFSGPYDVIAETGFAPNRRLVAPCDYRFVSPMLAGGASRLFNVSTSGGFFIVSMAASVALLCLTCHLAVRLGATVAGGMTAMAVIAMSIGHLKNNLYFNNSMEGVTQALMIGWCLAMFARRWNTATALCVVGLCTREMFLIPSVLLCGRLGVEWWRTRNRSELARLTIAAGLATAAIILPRMLIPVAATIQLIDPLYDENWLSKLLHVPLNWKRDLNLLVGIVSYGLPALMLLTRERLRFVRQKLAPFRAGASYVALWLALSMWGGTDLYRYVTYLFLPLVFMLSAMFADSRVRPRAGEVTLVLVATAFHNHIFSHIPALGDDVDVYLDFWPAYEDRLNAAAGVRVLEIAAFVLVAIGWRWASRAGIEAEVPSSQPEIPQRQRAA